MQEQKPTSLFKTDRRAFMKLMAAAGLAFAVPHIDTLRAYAAADETINDIINVAATAEALATALNGFVAANAAGYDNGQGLSPTVVRWVKGIQAQEKVHYEFLVAAGAKPAATTFTIPPSLEGITKSSKDLFAFVLQAEDLFISAYNAAAQRFAQYGQPDLTKVAYQIAGVECEHRVLVNYGFGAVPPNDRAYEKALLRNVVDAVPVVRDLGLLGSANPIATIRYEDFMNVDFSNQDQAGLKP